MVTFLVNSQALKENWWIQPSFFTLQDSQVLDLLDVSQTQPR